ncbi:uncharacterized protein LOC106081926 isoform X2 [Stomoxys calcitrans]|uniref:Uncharacterized protein n=1 Tax=Stomoxys calcitrans TaxID=35570 RepID=A0A1I8PBY9_STOCA|nr:uncharacterized protein LOC106081926 isoform X2 [Stomoxys calcitrans]
MVANDGGDNCMCSDGSSSNSNENNTKNLTKNHKHAKYRHHNAYNTPTTFTLSLIIGIWCLFGCVTSIPGAAVYTNFDFRSNPTFEPICNLQEEHFIESDGKESSLILEFNTAGAAAHQHSCTRILSAPPNYGFIIRLILPKIRHTSQKIGNHHLASNTPQDRPQRSATKGAASSKNNMPPVSDKLNTSTILKPGPSCPLSIFSSHDPHTAQWRVDPCQLEDTAPEMDDPVRLFRGRVRIVWDHGNQTLKSKLMVTALGKGDQCRSENKHQCLQIGDDPILCISKDLICDGIRHCPNSNEYDSDEDYAMCWRHSRMGEPVPPVMDSDIFEHFALEVFRNLFAFDAPAMGKGASATNKPGENATSPQSDETLNEILDIELTVEKENSTKGSGKADNATSFLGSHHHRRNGTRAGLNSDLSKYGPWGYLMLGMLLCGGALLICGLWASASQHAANNERESALQSANAAANAAAGLGQDNHSSPNAPPNYEELDPPPAYSVLFPNQKAASSNTLNSMDVQGSTPSQLSPSAAPSSRSTARTNGERPASSSTMAHNN